MQATVANAISYRSFRSKSPIFHQQKSRERIHEHAQAEISGRLREACATCSLKEMRWPCAPLFKIAPGDFVEPAV
ncbi:MAG TPA: hypothetical protein VJS89_03925 [Gammaproteobacteria bacterium]|nr:hypothetical protein [Gammaproteobacteria bacterium]